MVPVASNVGDRSSSAGIEIKRSGGLERVHVEKRVEPGIRIVTALVHHEGLRSRQDSWIAAHCKLRGDIAVPGGRKLKGNSGLQAQNRAQLPTPGEPVD